MLPLLPGGESGDEDLFDSIGDEGDSCDTKASADLEKMKPRCSRALLTVWRDLVGTRI